MQQMPLITNVDVNFMRSEIYNHENASKLKKNAMEYDFGLWLNMDKIYFGIK